MPWRTAGSIKRHGARAVVVADTIFGHGRVMSHLFRSINQAAKLLMAGPSKGVCTYKNSTGCPAKLCSSLREMGKPRIAHAGHQLWYAKITSADPLALSTLSLGELPVMRVS